MKTINACGRECIKCKTYGPECRGCYNLRDFLPEVPEKDMCPIYQCSMEKTSHRICSECNDLPCENYSYCIDPEYSDEQNIKDIKDRVKILKLLQKSNEDIV